MFVAAAGGLWLLFLVQAINSPILLDDWFQIRYWRDHEMGATALWEYARFNYFHYNPRIGELVLAIVHGSRAFHLIATPLVQLALLPCVYVIAFARWPRPTLRDLQLLLFLQTMIWLVIPISGIIYFYRPIATNYLWSLTITLALFVPYRLALVGSHARRLWLVPIMLALGWIAGMCNEHTGPTAMVAMAAFVYAAWRMRRLRAWMLAGMVGLYVGYPMLFFAPGQSVRYGGIALEDTPTKLLADRGILGCFAILGDFLWESRLAIVVFAAAIGRYVVTRIGKPLGWPARRDVVVATTIAAAAAAIVMTLFVSPTTSDRVFVASGVLLVAAFAVLVANLFDERVVRRFVVGACVIVFGFHVIVFVQTGFTVKAENDERLALLAATEPGTVAVVPTYEHRQRSRWHLGDDFVYWPWLRDYVGGELFDVPRVDLDRLDHLPDRRLPPRIAASAPIAHVPTYRELQSVPHRIRLAAELAGLDHFTLRGIHVYDDPRGRPTILLEWSPAGYRFIDGRPYDDIRGHFIRVDRASVPARIESWHLMGCAQIQPVQPLLDDELLIPVDERFCRGPFIAIACDSDRCWVAGWY